MVEPNSINRDEHSLEVEFNVVDDKNSLIKVTYSGVVPDLFKEGKESLLRGICRWDFPINRDSS